MKKNKTKTGTIVFRCIYGFLTFALIAAISYGLWNLWHFLEAYEKSQPEIPAENFISEIRKNKTIYFDKLEFTPNEFEDKSFAEEYFNELVNSITTYSRNGKESTEEKTVYTLKNGQDNIANITVEAVGNDLGYNLCEYEVTDVQFGQVVTSAYSVTVPNNAVLYCNGKEVSQSYITEIGTAYEETKHFYDLGTDFFHDDVYTIDGFIKEPVFTAKNKDGELLEFNNGKFILTAEKDEELSQLALNFAQSYSKYILQDEYLYNVASYIAPNMQLYNDIANFDNNWSYLSYYRTGYEFSNETAYDPFFYSENSASVRVTYDHIMYGVAEEVSADHIFTTQADYTVYLVKLEDEWKVTDIIIN